MNSNTLTPAVSEWRRRHKKASEERCRALEARLSLAKSIVAILYPEVSNQNIVKSAGPWWETTLERAMPYLNPLTAASAAARTAQQFGRAIPSTIRNLGRTARNVAPEAEALAGAASRVAPELAPGLAAGSRAAVNVGREAVPAASVIQRPFSFGTHGTSSIPELGAPAQGAAASAASTAPAAEATANAAANAANPSHLQRILHFLGEPHHGMRTPAEVAAGRAALGLPEARQAVGPIRQAAGNLAHGIIEPTNTIQAGLAETARRIGGDRFANAVNLFGNVSGGAFRYGTGLGPAANIAQDMIHYGPHRNVITNLGRAIGGGIGTTGAYTLLNRWLGRGAPVDPNGQGPAPGSAMRHPLIAGNADYFREAYNSSGIPGWSTIMGGPPVWGPKFVQFAGNLSDTALKVLKNLRRVGEGQSQEGSIPVDLQQQLKHTDLGYGPITHQDIQMPLDPIYQSVRTPQPTPPPVLPENMTGGTPATPPAGIPINNTFPPIGGDRGAVNPHHLAEHAATLLQNPNLPPEQRQAAQQGLIAAAPHLDTAALRNWASHGGSGNPQHFLAELRSDNPNTSVWQTGMAELTNQVHNIRSRLSTNPMDAQAHNQMNQLFTLAGQTAGAAGTQLGQWSADQLVSSIWTRMGQTGRIAILAGLGIAAAGLLDSLSGGNLLGGLGPWMLLGGIGAAGFGLYRGAGGNMSRMFSGDYLQPAMQALYRGFQQQLPGQQHYTPPAGPLPLPNRL